MMAHRFRSLFSIFTLFLFKNRVRRWYPHTHNFYAWIDCFPLNNIIPLIWHVSSELYHGEQLFLLFVTVLGFNFRLSFPFRPPNVIFEPPDLGMLIGELKNTIQQRKCTWIEETLKNTKKEASSADDASTTKKILTREWNINGGINTSEYLLIPFYVAK